MNHGAPADRTLLDRSLQQLGSLIGELERIAEPRARQSAQQAIELLLDLHGLALARLTSIIAAANGEPTLGKLLAADPHVCAILLLHGLHPQDAGERIRETLSRLQAQWQVRGFRVDFVSLAPASARVRVHRFDTSENPQVLLHEVEAALIDAAPDLDDIVVEFEQAVENPQNPAIAETMEIAL